MKSYATIQYANWYFSTRLKSAVWDNATTDRKIRALLTATSALNRLNFEGEKLDHEQELEFPRGPGPRFPYGRELPYSRHDGIELPDKDCDKSCDTIPNEVMQACCEEAYSLLDGRDPELEASTLNQTHIAFEGIRITKGNLKDIETPTHILNGITSALAWNLLRPYLRDPRTVHLSRVN